MDKKLIENVKEAAVFTAIFAGIGYISKKAIKKSITNDPSSSIMNAAEWTAVMVGSIYVRDYLIKEKVISS